MANRPDGWQTVVPRLVVRDTAAQVAFLKAVFGATGRHLVDRPSEIRIGECMILVSGPDARPPMEVFLYVYVDDVDGVHARAVAAGARSLEEPVDLPYGDRRATISDTAGNMWQIATRA